MIPLNKINLSSYLLSTFCLLFIGCQNPAGKSLQKDNLRFHFTGWPKKSVDRLFQQFLETKQFLVSNNREGVKQYDRKGSNWDHLKYGSFLEPTAWLRILPELTEEKEPVQTTMTIQVRVITHRHSSLEEDRNPRSHHMKEVQNLMREFEIIMLQPTSLENNP